MNTEKFIKEATEKMAIELGADTLHAICAGAKAASELRKISGAVDQLIKKTAEQAARDSKKASA